ncbi:hypothetical protein QYF36_010281 [Acer negundo]|nr:hypothetical protein QYF36_010281 [Acer negundo]
MVVNKETKEGMMRDFGHLSSDKRTFADVLEGRKQRVEVNKVSFEETEPELVGNSYSEQPYFVDNRDSRRDEVTCNSQEKRKIGEKLPESLDSDSLSSSKHGSLRGECSTRNREEQCGLGLTSHSTIGLKPGQLIVVLGPFQNNSRPYVLDQEANPVVTTYKDNSVDGNMDLILGFKNVFLEKEISGHSHEGSEEGESPIVFRLTWVWRCFKPLVRKKEVE